jgi:hypothetical protein
MSWQFHPRIECDYFEERIGVWKDVVRFVSQPRKYPDKPSIPLWSFYGLVPRADRELSKDRVHYRACGANMAVVNALQIDYDSGVMTLDRFIDDHLGLDYALYTSPSHTQAHQKFRVVIPLKTPLLNAYLFRGKVRGYLLSMFPECDQSTINTFRKQRMPAVPLTGEAYRYNIGEGSRLELDMAEIARLSISSEEPSERAEIRPLSEELDPFDTPIEVLEQRRELLRLVAKYSEELPILRQTPRGGGTVHASLVRMCTALRHCGMTQADMAGFFDRFGFCDSEITNIITKWVGKL